MLKAITSPENTQASTKQNSFISIGKHRVRIRDDHHALLSEISADIPYLSLEEILFVTSFYGATLLQIFNPFTLKGVRDCALAGKR